jgi:hypothetical protein
VLFRSPQNPKTPFTVNIEANKINLKLLLFRIDTNGVKNPHSVGTAPCPA